MKISPSLASAFLNYAAADTNYCFISFHFYKIWEDDQKKNPATFLNHHPLLSVGRNSLCASRPHDRVHSLKPSWVHLGSCISSPSWFPGEYLPGPMCKFIPHLVKRDIYFFLTWIIRAFSGSRSLAVGLWGGAVLIWGQQPLFVALGHPFPFHFLSLSVLHFPTSFPFSPVVLPWLFPFLLCVLELSSLGFGSSPFPNPGQYYAETLHISDVPSCVSAPPGF